MFFNLKGEFYFTVGKKKDEYNFLDDDFASIHLKANMYMPMEVEIHDGRNWSHLVLRFINSVSSCIFYSGDYSKKIFKTYVTQRKPSSAASNLAI